MNNKIINDFKPGNLVLYKSSPAEIIKINDKIEIALADKKTVKVRSKDIIFLHPGPVSDLSDLIKNSSDSDHIKDACSILQGETVSLKELSELAYEVYNAETAWAVCSHLLDGLYISGTVDNIAIRLESDVEKDIASRKQKEDEKLRWAEFTRNVKEGKTTADDNRYMFDLEQFALGKQKSSKLLKDLKIPETAENAHSLLLKLKYWDWYVNPYISRMGFSSDISYPEFKSSDYKNYDGERLDLTHHESFAVDDEGNSDPDDAVSFEDGKLWIHVADPSYALSPADESDINAMDQGANIYLPEKKIAMLNPQYTDVFGLGLNTVSPAMSFCIELDDDGSVINCGIYFTKIKVKRITYNQAQELLGSHPFDKINDIAKKHKKYRISRGASFFRFPEVKIKVKDNEVSITPYNHLESTDMIMETMLMAGESAALYAEEKNIPFLYSTQGGQSEENTASSLTDEESKDLAQMYACVRKLSPGIVKSRPDIHSGLGLSSYSRVTSPLRRYIDLAAHHQLRLSLEGKILLTDDEIITRIGKAGAGASAVSKLEKLSNRHWTLVYLLENPGWVGKGIIVDKKERSDTVIIPELAFESVIPAQKNRSLNEEITLKVTGIDLPKLNAFFSTV